MRPRVFNMIEITLALGVIGIGVASILVLFPIGLGASRDAMAETYAANVADQFLHYVRYQASIRDTTPGNGVGWDDWILDPVAPKVPTSWPGGPSNSNLACPPTLPTGSGLLGSAGTIHEMRPTPVPGVYEIVAYVDGSPDNDQIDAAELVDFRGIMAVWQEDVPSLDTDNDPTTPNNRNIGVALRCQVSWPAVLPYESRQKSSYYLELFNRQ